MSVRVLSLLEARVLGVLVEKQHTVPDTYPLSLNALVAGCNQKTARQPVIEAAEEEVLMAVDSLKHMSLLFEASGGRVARYEHNMARGLLVPSAAVALLATLMLRGPQTAAELRLNSERLHCFADISSVEAFLDELALKDPPRVVKLARAPGSREARWAHLLCGEASLPAASVASFAEGGAAAGADSLPSVSLGELVAIKAELARLAQRVETLEGDLAGVKRELGMAP